MHKDAREIDTCCRPGVCQHRRKINEEDTVSLSIDEKIRMTRFDDLDFKWQVLASPTEFQKPGDDSTVFRQFIWERGVSGLLH